jgi:hypothetical protein
VAKSWTARWRVLTCPGATVVRNPDQPKATSENIAQGTYIVTVSAFVAAVVFGLVQTAVAWYTYLHPIMPMTR